MLHIPLSGYCPTKDKEVTIHQGLLDSHTNDDEIIVYTYGNLICPYASHSGDCVVRPCPLDKRYSLDT